MTSNAISGNETITGNLSVAGTTNLAATTISGLTLTVPVTRTPLNGVYNNSTAVTNSKIIYLKGTTTQGQVTFYPTTTAASGGPAIFNTLLNVQANAVLATTSGGSCPCTSIYSASTTSVVINCVVTLEQVLRAQRCTAIGINCVHWNNGYELSKLAAEHHSVPTLC